MKIAVCFALIFFFNSTLFAQSSNSEIMVTAQSSLSERLPFHEISQVTLEANSNLTAILRFKGIFDDTDCDNRTALDFHYIDLVDTGNTKENEVRLRGGYSSSSNHPGFWAICDVAYRFLAPMSGEVKLSHPWVTLPYEEPFDQFFVFKDRHGLIIKKVRVQFLVATNSWGLTEI